jgi:hypothetical protein
VLEAESWVKSFTKVNLHPHRRVSFPEWCKRISHFLQGGEGFKPEKLQDTYALLPAFWHAMSKESKEQAVSIFSKHDSTFSVECVRTLSASLHVPMSGEPSPLHSHPLASPAAHKHSCPPHPFPPSGVSRHAELAPLHRAGQRGPEPPRAGHA